MSESNWGDGARYVSDCSYCCSVPEVDRKGIQPGIVTLDDAVFKCSLGKHDCTVGSLYSALRRLSRGAARIRIS